MASSADRHLDILSDYERGKVIGVWCPKLEMRSL